MSGIITPSMQVNVVRNDRFGIDTYSTLYMGIGKVLRHGAYDETVMAKLRWMNHELAPLLAKARERGRRHRHQGHRRAGGADGRRDAQPQQGEQSAAAGQAGAAPGVGGRTRAMRSARIKFIDEAGHFILNMVMAGCKGILDAASGIPESTIVTAIARNGNETGIRVSGTGDRWFTAPAPMIDGVYFPGFGPEDANPDLGDSAITETIGLGSMAMAGAPAVVEYVGGTPQFALETTMKMYEITAGENKSFKLPSLHFRGTPLGVDIRKVVKTGITPVINTGIACKRPGVGQIGAGLTAVPIAVLREGAGGVCRDPRRDRGLAPWRGQQEHAMRANEMTRLRRGGGHPRPASSLRAAGAGLPGPHRPDRRPDRRLDLSRPAPCAGAGARSRPAAARRRGARSAARHPGRHQGHLRHRRHADRERHGAACRAGGRAEDATVVALLRAAGAVILGKTVTAELAVYAPGKTTNPHDARRTPGGSSSGSAAAVAAAMVPLAVGTQTNGSVLRPASYCGVYGYKPSHGSISRHGVLKQSPTLDQVGVFARSVDDVALIAGELFRYDGKDPDVRPDTRPRPHGGAQPGRWRAAAHRVRQDAAVAERDRDARSRPSPRWRRAAATSCTKWSCRRCSSRPSSGTAPSWNRTWRTTTRPSTPRGKDRLSDALREMIERGQRYTGAEYSKARDGIALLEPRAGRSVCRLRRVLTPATTGVAPLGLASTGSPMFCTIWTLCGVPAISLPILQGEDGMPLGVQLVAARRNDAHLLRVAKRLEARCGAGSGAVERAL